MHDAHRAATLSLSAVRPHARKSRHLAAHPATRPAGGICMNETAEGAGSVRLAAAMLAALVIGLLTHAPVAHAQSVAAGGDHTCAFTPAGGLVCWGSNDTGEIGDNTVIDRTTPTNVIGLPFGSTALAAGYSHSCAVTNAGAAMCWGSNANGQIGDGTAIQRLLPVGVFGIASGATRIVAGFSHTCALVGGGVLCWGKNNNGQLGTGTAPTADQLTPVGVSGLGAGVLAIAGGYNHNCAINGAGGVQCWGANFGAQLGNASANINFEAAPIQVTGLTSGVMAIAAGSDHSCALTSGGAVKCWGDNTTGAIGAGSTTMIIETPVDVVGLSSGVTAIAAGQFHTCALLSGGAVKCWGKNSVGQVGDGTTANRNAPVNVIASGVTAIAAGANHTCALFGVGVSSCWGANVNGQMGYGAIGGPSYVPVSSAYPAATSTMLASGLNPSVFGDSITFTATVTGGVNGTPVVFQVGGVNIAGCAALVLTSGAATCTLTSLVVGTYSITAIYQGNAGTLASTSSVLSQVVNKANQTITFDALANKIDTDPPFTVTASTSSGLTVTFSSTTTSICTVSGNTVTIVVAGTCTIAANQAGTANYNVAPQVTQSFTVQSTGPALALTAVLSRKTHGAAGTFDIPINSTVLIGGAVSVESRTIGTGHRIVFQYNIPITSPGTATAVDVMSSPVGSAAVSAVGSEVTVTLTGIPNNKRVTVSLTNVNGLGQTQSASIGFLIGDASNDRAVNVIDVNAVRARSGQPVTATNFRFDFDASGSINVIDVNAVRARSGTTLL